MRSLGTEFFYLISTHTAFHNKWTISEGQIQHLKTIKKVDINICRISSYSYI